MTVVVSPIQSVLVVNPRELLDTVADPACGLLNRENRTKCFLGVCEKNNQNAPRPSELVALLGATAFIRGLAFLARTANVIERAVGPRVLPVKGVDCYLVSYPSRTIGTLKNKPAVAV